MKKFVIGDIHGAHKALLQVFERSGFNKSEDLLICLGDVADGWPEVPECFTELREIKNLVYVLGNHDYWLLKFFESGAAPAIWLTQGGKATMDAYDRYAQINPAEILFHIGMLKSAPYYYILDNKLFVHGGYDWHYPIEEADLHDMMWDRDLYVAAAYWENQGKKGLPLNRVKDYDEVFIGHTSTSYYYSDLKPVHISNVWNLDQGAGWEGKLTLLDIDSKEFWQSDIVKDLYPGVKGRG